MQLVIDFLGNWIAPSALHLWKDQRYRRAVNQSGKLTARSGTAVLLGGMQSPVTKSGGLSPSQASERNNESLQNNDEFVVHWEETFALFELRISPLLLLKVKGDNRAKPCAASQCLTHRK